MRFADVAIIGAGVTGASVAYHLALKGCKNILILERNPGPGLESTSKATGGFRVQFGTEINVRLSLLARQKLLRFQEELGVDPGFQQHGYLFLVEEEEHLVQLRRAMEIQRAAGVDDVCEIKPSEIAGLNSKVRRDDLVGGILCPSDGFIRPMNILQGYLQGAQRLGAVVQYGVDVAGFTKNKPNHIDSIRTPKEEINVGAVVNTAGAWAGVIGELAGVNIPIVPVRRQVAITDPFNGLPDSMPMTIFVKDGFHLRVRDGRVLLLRPDDTPGAHRFDSTFDERWLEGLTARAQKTVPCLKQTSVDRQQCWTGLYEMSPDKHALLGRVSPFENFYIAGGSSGHGVMHAPALGQLLAEEIIDGAAHSLDAHCLRPSRFEGGKPNVGLELL